MAAPTLRDLTLDALEDGIDLDKIEAAVVRAAVNSTGRAALHYRLVAAFDTGVADTELDRRFAGACCDTDAVVAAFEALVDPTSVKTSGAVFTPSAIADFMASWAIRSDNASGDVIDPAVGCGALLVAALRRIHELTGRAPSEIAGAQLHGVELVQSSAERAETLLALTCLGLGDSAPFDANIDVADSLRCDWGRTYDTVIANPPYVRYQNLSEADRSELAGSFEVLSTGNFNLYYAFFELAARLCPEGRIAYITPNNYFTTASAGALRDWMARHRFPSDIIDFGHHKVFDALTYTALTLSERGARTASFGYSTITPDALDTWRPDVGQPVTPDAGPSRWSLVGADRHDLVQAIRDGGPPLSSLVDIRYGIATLRDRLYLLAGPANTAGHLETTYQGVRYAIEADATRPILRMSGLADQAALDANTQAVIYPYDVVDGRAVAWSEERLRDEYPLCATYFDAIRGELARRDKGKKTYATWFAYGRTQGLVPVAEKLVSPLYASSPRFLTDRSAALLINGVSVAPRYIDGAPTLDALSVLLNSSICRAYVSETASAIQGGYHAYQKSQLSGLGVCDLSGLDALAGADPADIDAWLCARYGVELPDEYRATSTHPRPVVT